MVLSKGHRQLAQREKGGMPSPPISGQRGGGDQILKLCGKKKSQNYRQNDVRLFKEKEGKTGQRCLTDRRGRGEKQRTLRAKFWVADRERDFY